jgi:hypothetical protein
LAAIGAAVAILAAPATAGAAIVDFGIYSDNAFDPGETYSEDGFTFTVVSGVEWGIQTNGGNPPSSLHAGNGGAIGVGDTISITQDGGGLFTFDSFDYASFSFNQSDDVTFIGLVNGVQAQSLANLFSSTTTWATLNSVFGAPIDELRIVGSSQHTATLMLDNFVLTPSQVPEPSTLLLLGVGAGAAVLRRRLHA